jgi:hypothetical protein
MKKSTITLICILVLSAISPVQAASYQQADGAGLTADRVVESLHDLTEANYSYCVRALKMNREFLGYIDREGYDLLERVIKLSAALTTAEGEKRERYKKLFELMYKIGAQPRNSCKDRVTPDDFKSSPELQIIVRRYEGELRERFPQALAAVKAKNIHVLEPVLNLYPELVQLYDLTEKKTLLHVAAEQFDAHDMDSVQMFAYLMRKGADVDMQDGKNCSVTQVMKKGHPASELFKTELAALRVRSMPPIDVSIDHAKKILVPLYEQIKPYQQYVAGVLACIGFLVWVMRPASTGKSHARAVPVGALERLV